MTDRAAIPLHPVAREIAESQGGLKSYPPVERWDNWEEYDPVAWPRKVKRHYSLIPTICFNCEAGCGLLAYVDRETLAIQKFEGNPAHPGAAGATAPRARDAQPGDRPGADPLSAAPGRPARGGRWERVTWDEVLDDIGGRIRKALVEGRQREVMYHLGRPGHELVYLQRVFHAWGIDGHNSHTNVCSASARAGYAFWHGMDRPSPDHANARFILLLSSHLETGHYFNPHAQRIMEAKSRGAKIAVFDTRLSNTASMADWWLAPWPGSESAVLLAMAHILVREKLYDREFVRRWVNWDEYLREERPDLPVTFDVVRARDRRAVRALHAGVRRSREQRPGRDDRRDRARDRPRRLGAGDPHLAQYRRRQPRRLAGGARARADRGAHGRGRHARRHRAERLEQGGAGAADDAAAGQDLE